MHYESMHGAHYVVPGKECNIQIMLILGDNLGIVSTNFYFFYFFPITIIVVNETWNTTFYFLSLQSQFLMNLKDYLKDSSYL